VCIFRDPIDKWLSAINFLHDYTNNQEYKVTFPIDVDYILHLQTTTQVLIEAELKSQYYFLGDKYQYDECYPLYDISKLLNKLTDVDLPIINSAPKLISKKDLSYKHINTIKEIYKDDYINGWHY
jgi:hypothetical protein